MVHERTFHLELCHLSKGLYLYPIPEFFCVSPPLSCSPVLQHDCRLRHTHGYTPLCCLLGSFWAQNSWLAVPLLCGATSRARNNGLWSLGGAQLFRKTYHSSSGIGLKIYDFGHFYLLETSSSWALPSLHMYYLSLLPDHPCPGACILGHNSPWECLPEVVLWGWLFIFMNLFVQAWSKERKLCWGLESTGELKQHSCPLRTPFSWRHTAINN